MSRVKVLLSTVLIGMLAMGTASAQSDDVYYDPRKDPSTHSTQDYNQSGNQQPNSSQDYNSQSTQQNNSGNYNSNSYTDETYADDEYYYNNDYNYTTQLRRYYYPGYSLSYYNDWYDPYYYWGAPVVSYGFTPWYYHRHWYNPYYYDGFYGSYYNPFYSSFSYGYGWGWGGCFSPFYGGYGYGYGYTGYGAGYYGGHGRGYYDYGYRNWTATSVYSGPRHKMLTAGSNTTYNNVQHALSNRHRDAGVNGGNMSHQNGSRPGFNGSNAIERGAIQNERPYNGNTNRGGNINRNENSRTFSEQGRGNERPYQPEPNHQAATQQQQNHQSAPQQRNYESSPQPRSYSAPQSRPSGGGRSSGGGGGFRSSGGGGGGHSSGGGGGHSGGGGHGGRH